MDRVHYHTVGGTFRAKRSRFEDGDLPKGRDNVNSDDTRDRVRVVYLDVPVRVKLFRETFTERFES